MESSKAEAINCKESKCYRSELLSEGSD